MNSDKKIVFIVNDKGVIYVPINNDGIIKNTIKK